MNCPKCNDRLSIERVQDGRFYLCRQCKGLWVENEQLVKLAKTVRPGDISSWPEVVSYDLNEDHSAATSYCPQCQQRMKPRNYCYDSNILIDQCGSCKGLWLDSGKIFKIAEFLNAPPQTARAKAILLNQSAPIGQQSEITQVGLNIFFELIAELVVELFD